MRKGRQLEIIIEKISYLAIPNAKIESPCMVKDIDTGETREVDIGIRIASDSREIFIAIECRDRKAVQDVTWIEQLISKKESIGADRLIAVTSSNFSESARIKAKKRGIELENIYKFDSQKLTTFCNEIYIETLSFVSEFTSIELYLPASSNVILNEESIFFDKSINQEIKSEDFLKILSNSFLEQVILGNPKDNLHFCDYFNQYYSDLEKSALEKLGKSSQVIENRDESSPQLDKSKIKIWTTVKFKTQNFMILIPENLYLMQSGQYIDIQDIRVTANIFRKIRRFPVSAIYSSEKVELLEHKIEAENLNSELTSMNSIDIVIDKESKEAQWWICWSDVQKQFPEECLVQIIFTNQIPIVLKSIFVK